MLLRKTITDLFFNEAPTCMHINVIFIIFPRDTAIKERFL